MVNPEEVRRLTLKLQAFKESFETKIAKTVGEYEDRIADLRVELTIMSESLQAARRELEEKEARDFVEAKENSEASSEK